MALKIYGIPQNRTYRVLWMANELGIPFERIQPEHTGEAYKKINPNAKMPAIDDDGVILWESMAINLYLAKKYGKDIAPKNAVEEALATQWSFWAMTEVEKSLLNALFATLGIGGQAKDPEKVKACYEELKKPFGVLNQHLEGKQYLVGNRFTVADLNVAAVLSWAQISRLDLAPFPNLKRWLEASLGREAAAKARK